MILLALLLADPMGQHHGMDMPGMTMPVAKPTPAKKPSGRAAKRSPRKPAPSRKAGAMTHGAMSGMTMPGMAVPSCSPEHAAMGHCNPAAASPPGGSSAGSMPGHDMSDATAPVASCPPEHAAMGHCVPASAAMPAGHGADHQAAMPEMPGMSMEGMGAAAIGAGGCSPEHAAMGHCQAAPVTGEAVVGNAPPPSPPTSRAADRYYDPAVMAAADRRMRMEHGGMRFSQILFNLAELQVRDGRDGYRWDGEGWFGGDVDRLVVKSEGEGTLGGSIGEAEVQALYARAIDPYWNLQAGVRQDVGQGARRTYAVVGVEGLAPYWFDVEGALFLSDRGDVLARAEAWVDQRITQRAILQPRVEVNLAAQDVPDQRIAAGVSDIELGLRLRYEIAREFAPYVGVSWERRYGPAGGGGAALALGIRTWF